MMPSELAAQTPQPMVDQIDALAEPLLDDLATPAMARLAAGLPVDAGAPQSWYASVSSARLHWYDLIAGFPARPDIHDPVGRYQRRMQFELEAVAQQHHLLLAITRPRVRFDPDGAIHWAFFSLKLTLPLLVGLEQRRSNISFDLTVPFAATLKKPIVSLTPNFVTLNWGGLVEAFSVHDIVQAHAPEQAPSQVFYVGQTRDADARLAHARLPALQKLHARHKEEFDTLLLVQQLDVRVNCADGDPAALPQYAHPRAAAVLQGERMDVLEAALIRYFEGAAPLPRKPDERALRRARLEAVRQANHLVQFTIDLQWPELGAYGVLGAEQAPVAARHLLSCFIADGEAIVSRMPAPAPATGETAPTRKKLRGKL